MEIQPFAAHFYGGIEVDNGENTIFLDKPGQPNVAISGWGEGSWSIWPREDPFEPSVLKRASDIFGWWSFRLVGPLLDWKSTYYDTTYIHTYIHDIWSTTWPKIPSFESMLILNHNHTTIWVNSHQRKRWQVRHCNRHRLGPWSSTRQISC